MEITIYFQKILVPRLFSMKASTHWSMASTWQQISIEYLNKCIRFFQEFEKKMFNVVCSVSLTSAGNNWDFDKRFAFIFPLQHVSTTSALFKMYFLPLWCQTAYGWRGLWRGRSSPPGTNKPCPVALSFFLFSFICCHHRLCKHHSYNQLQSNCHLCKRRVYDYHSSCKHPLSNQYSSQ